MSIFKKKVGKEIGKKERQELEIFDINDIYVLTTSIVSSYNDGNGNGPIYITKKYLAEKEDENFYELFSGVKFSNSTSFDVPKIEKVEHLTDFVILKGTYTKLSAKVLFYLITQWNTGDEVKRMM